MGLEEEDLVDDLLSLRWRPTRARRAETGHLDFSSKLQLIQAAKWPTAAGDLLKPQPNQPERDGFSRLLGSTVGTEVGGMATLSIYEARLQKMLERAQDRLAKLQKERLAGKAIQRPQPVKNEPNSQPMKTQIVQKTDDPPTPPVIPPAVGPAPDYSEPAETSAEERANR